MTEPALSRHSPRWPSAASSVVGVIGDPVRHSLSPLLHNAAFDALGLDWVSVAFEVAAGTMESAVAGMRALGIVGLSVTMPHKHDACLLVRQEQPEREWFCYEDHGYKHIPGLLAWRVAKLLRSHPWPTPAIIPHVPDEERKRRAIWSYTSQIAPLEQDHALSARMEGRVPEQFWRLAPPPSGWEGLADFI